MNEERPIEKLLRRYAKKRRDDAGAPDLHPAARRMLQGEVARQFPQPAGGRQTFLSWLPWLGWATVMVAVVGVGAWAYFGKHENVVAVAPAPKTESVLRLAKNEPPTDRPAKAELADRDAGARKQLAESAALAPTPAPLRTTVLDSSDNKAPARSIASNGQTRSGQPGGGETKSLSIAAPSTFKETAQTQNAPSGPTAARQLAADSANDAKSSRIAGAGGGAKSLSLTSPRAATDEKISSDKLAVTTPALAGRVDDLNSQAKPDAQGFGAPATASTTFARRNVQVTSGNVAAQANGISQSYANVRPVNRAAKSVPAGPVLNNFQVQQSGTQLRVIDGDGSTYVGEAGNFPATPEQSAGTPAEAKGATALKTKRSEAEQNYLYRVAGTNRTLNQAVEFSWNFVAPTNALAQEQTNLGVLSGADRSKDVPVNQGLIQNSTINGRARLGINQEIEIQAVPVNVETLKAFRGK